MGIALANQKWDLSMTELLSLKFTSYYSASKFKQQILLNKEAMTHV